MYPPMRLDSDPHTNLLIIGDRPQIRDKMFPNRRSLWLTFIFSTPRPNTISMNQTISRDVTPPIGSFVVRHRVKLNAEDVALDFVI
jgi:hypothetical protein